MSNAVYISSAQQSLGKIEQILIRGDLSSMNEVERVTYYKAVCDTVGLNPMTKPFDYITLNGKLVLYAKRDATDQLRKIHNVSIKITARETIEGVYVVTAQARMPSGREDESTGAVHTAGLKGDMLANAYMKAETKAKRRVTLSICGLGLLDETEVADIPNKEKNPIFVDQPGPDDGSTEPTGYRVSFGQWKGRSIEEIYRAFGHEKIANYIAYLEESAAKKGVSPSQQIQEFISHAETYLGAMENGTAYDFNEDERQVK